MTDHHARTVQRNSSKRVIGILLGQDNGKTVTLQTPLVSPSRRTRRTARHGSSITTTLRGCGRCSRRSTVCSSPSCHDCGPHCGSARERMIGWYHTGPKLRASDQEINDLLKRYIARPVMVIVDVRPNTVGIPTDAYFAVEEIKDVGRAVHVFTTMCSTNRLGRHRNAKDVPSRAVGNRSGGSRGDRRRAPSPRYQGLDHNNPRDPSHRAA